MTCSSRIVLCYYGALPYGCDQCPCTGRAVTQPQPPPPSFSMAFGRPPVPPASFAPLPVHPNAVPPASSAQAVLEAGNAQTTAVHGHNAVAEALNNLPLTAVQSVATDSAPGVEHHVTPVPVSGHAEQMASATEGNSAGDAPAEAVAQLDQQDTPMDVEVPGESNSDKNDAGEAPIGRCTLPGFLPTFSLISGLPAFCLALSGVQAQESHRICNRNLQCVRGKHKLGDPFLCF